MNPTFQWRQYKILAILLGNSEDLKDFTAKLIKFLKYDNKRFKEHLFYDTILKLRGET